MTSNGMLIAIEGVDGAGKRTQAELLGKALEARGILLARFSFPRYDSFFGKLVGQFLNGEFGNLESVDPRLSALLYAGDRFESKSELETALESGRVVLTDRYIASNLAHQTARVAADKRAEFSAWLRKLEYEVYGLPAEDLVVYLRVPAREGQRRVERKRARSYTDLKHDLQEADLSHLEQAAMMYDELAKAPRWVTIECTAEGESAPRQAESVHREVLAAAESALGHRMGRRPS